jgi:hypothetical protein
MLVDAQATTLSPVVERPPRECSSNRLLSLTALSRLFFVPYR